MDSGWVITVATIPFDGAAVLIDHARDEQMIPVRNPTPADVEHTEPATTVDGTGSPARRRRRHVWVDGAGHHLVPGLVIDWRRHAATAEWEALVAVPGGRGGGALIQWRAATAMRSGTDDSWSPEKS